MNLVDKHVPEDDLALFALALLSPEDTAFTREHLKQCGQCRDEVARMLGDLATYALSAEMHDPSPQARARLLGAVAKETKAPVAAPEPAVAIPIRTSAPPADRGRLRKLPPPPPSVSVMDWAGWAVAACLSAFAGWQFHQDQTLRIQLATRNAALARLSMESDRAQQVLRALTDPGAMQVTLHLPAKAATPPKPEGHASYNASRGELVFVATHLAPLQGDKIYQLWLLPRTGAPVPAGTFTPDSNGNASVVLPKLPMDVPARGFGVTIESEGGSDVPTTPIVLLGTSA